MKRQRQPVEERFWRYVQKGGEDECWPWVGYCDKDGYGNIKIEGKTVRAHRLSYALHKGPIPDDAKVCHSCDNPPCCNPKHLWLGTTLQNEADKISKGRQALGEAHGKSILTAPKVRRLRKRYATLRSYRKVAAEFGIDHSTVAQIVKRRTWAHLD